RQVAWFIQAISTVLENTACRSWTTTRDCRAGTMISLYAPEQPFNLLTLAPSDDGLLPVGRLSHRARADAPEAATSLPAHGHSVDVLDLDVLRLVLLFERLLDICLGGMRIDLEGVPPLRVEVIGALGDERPYHDLARCSRGHTAASLWRGLKFSSSRSIESFASSRCVWLKRSRMFRFRASTILTPARFSNERLTV